MTANGFRPYPAYKDSGVKWLGEVPEHWGVIPLKRVGWFCSGAGFPIRFQGNVRGDVLFAKVSDMNRSGNDRKIVSAANSVSREVARELGANVFSPGTIVFPKVGGALLTNKRRILVRETCIDNNLMGCVVTGAETDFVFRLLQWLDLGRMAKPGPVPAIGEGEVREIRVQLPPRSEQSAIVGFLDHADRRIQRYIRAKERLIELLEEQRQAIIHQAVTGQVDVRTGQPYPTYKDSGVGWLGEVPEHWEVRKLGQMGRFAKGSGGSKADESEDGVPCVRYGDLYTYHSFFINDSRGRVPAKMAESSYTPIHHGDVLFAGSGETLEEIGKSAVNLLTNSAYCGGDVIIFRPSIEVDPGFLGYATDCPLAIYQKACLGRGITVMHAYSSELKYMTVFLPTLAEQSAVSLFLDRTTTAIDRAVARTTEEVGLIREHRTRLIADVVTGKLDVREAAASLPEVDSPDADESQRAPEPNAAADPKSWKPAVHPPHP